MSVLLMQSTIAHTISSYNYQIQMTSLAVQVRSAEKPLHIDIFDISQVNQVNHMLFEQPNIALRWETNNLQSANHRVGS